MTWLNELRRRLHFRMHAEQYERDLAEEMRLHLELRAEEREADGLPAGAARAAAQRQFGNTTQLREQGREAWGWSLLDSFAQDLRYGCRSLASSPAFALTAILSLALGIGANTAIFSIINAVMLRALPVEDPRALVQIKQGENGDLTNPIWEQIRDRQRAFSGTLAYSENRFDLADGGESHFAQGLFVSGDYFRVLGVPAMRGRVLRADDDHRGADSLAVVSYAFWQRRFGGDPSIVGKVLRLDRHPFQIVGVTPRWFTGLNVDHGFDVAIPLDCEPLFHPDHSALDERLEWWLTILGRIERDESLSQARARMTHLAPVVFGATVPAGLPGDAQADYLASKLTLSPVARGFSETGMRYRKSLLMLMAIVASVLFIACANIASLLLARGSARRTELAVRMAIGAGRARVIRQLLTESLLLAALGAALGVLLALAGGRLLVHLTSTQANPLELNLTPDLRVFGFTIGAALATALLFGLLPAWRATRLELEPALRENARGAVGGATRFQPGKVLVVSQIALSLVLLVGAGLFLGTLRNLLTVDAGFTSHNVLLVAADFRQSGVARDQRTRTVQQILDRVRALPGVAAAATSAIVPLSGGGWAENVRPVGVALASGSQDSLLFLNRVSPGYFHTLRTPLVEGRDFDARDQAQARKVMILNETAARRFFGTANALGRALGVPQDATPGGTAKEELYEVIGVVHDAKYAQLDEAARPTGYFALAQDADPRPGVNFEIRSRGAIETVIPGVRSALTDVNRDVSLEFSNFETLAGESLLQPRMVAVLSAAFGLLALLLAALGLYGVTNYAAVRRKGEIGVRLALGEPRSSIVRLMLRDAVVLLALGLAGGVAASLALGRLVTGLLYEVRPNDPAELAGAVFVLAAAAGLAAYLPARRASRLDPMAALREE
jgi:predicted permease